jgi:hypothetical protein
MRDNNVVIPPGPAPAPEPTPTPTPTPARELTAEQVRRALALLVRAGDFAVKLIPGDKDDQVFATIKPFLEDELAVEIILFINQFLDGRPPTSENVRAAVLAFVARKSPPTP